MPEDGAVEMLADGRAHCVVCGLAFGVTNSKAVKQHLRSRPHKVAAAAAAAAAAPTTANTVGEAAEGMPAAPSATTKRGGGSRHPSDGVDGGAALLEMLGLEIHDGVATAATAPAQNKPGRRVLYATSAEAYARLVAGAGAGESPSDIRPCLPPPILRHPRRVGADSGTPFLTTQAAQLLPGVPRSLRECLDLYCSSTSCGRRMPNIDIEEARQEVCSFREAASLLKRAAREGRRFWATFPTEQIQHPRWWPKAAAGADRRGYGPASVPTYDQVIVGSGPTGIGCHIDTYQSVPVSTSLTIAAGRKRVILLPSEAGHMFPSVVGQESEEAQAAKKAEFPARPAPELVAKIAEAGGYFFDLMPAEDGPLTLFMPSGWHHWLLGDIDAPWHVVYGGSFFPGELDRR